MTWRPNRPGKFRGTLALRVNGRFPVRALVVGEAFPLGGGGAKTNRDDGRAFGNPAKTRPGGSSSSSGGGKVPGRRVSLGREGPRGLARSAPVSGALLCALRNAPQVSSSVPLMVAREKSASAFIDSAKYVVLERRVRAHSGAAGCSCLSPRFPL